MNVCMLAYAFYESDTRIIQYARALTQRGDTVEVFCLGTPGQSSPEVIDGVTVHRIQTRTKNEKGKFAYLGRILRFMLRATFALARRSKSAAFDLIHVHSVPDFLVFAAIVPKLRGAAVILDIHDILPEFYCSKFGAPLGGWVFRLLVLLERLSAMFSDHVIVANALWRPRLLKRSCREDKCTTICNYPDLEIFSGARRSHDGTFRILYPGTLNWHQGVDIAIHAFAAAAREMPEAEFHIYGEGPAKPSLIALAADLRLGERVKFFPTVPLIEIAQIMAQADLGVVPKRATSAFGNEAISTKVLQFMAVGVPVIVSRTAVDTYYHDESRVRYFDSEDVQDLASAMLCMRNNPELRVKLAAAAREHIVQNNWFSRRGEYLAVVDRVTQSAGTAVRCVRPNTLTRNH